MTIHRFFIAPEFIDHSQGLVLCHSSRLSKQVSKVLRLENGDQIDIVDGLGNIYHCILQNMGKRSDKSLFQAEIISSEKNTDEPLLKFTIALPLIKINRFEWALEKLSELGVDKIVPVNTHTSVIKTDGAGVGKTGANKLARWHKIIEEASEQCERHIFPDINSPIEFSDWINEFDETQSNTLKLICTERRQVISLAELLCNQVEEQNKTLSGCAIAVGAEGGFSEQEIDAALKKKFIPVSLGANILRSETAAIYSIAITRSLLLKTTNRH